MHELFEKVCEESQITKETIGDAIFYNHNKNSYYFAIDIGEEDLADLKSSIELVKYDKIIEAFVQLREQKEIGKVVDKNSALFVFVNCKDSVDWTKYRKQILLLEEDEFYMKKYVILYTRDLVNDISSIQGELIKGLQKNVLDAVEFQKFYENSNESAAYSFIIQLFLKIPFLSLPEKIDSFKELSEFIEERLSKSEQNQMNFLLNDASKIELLEFHDEETDLAEYLKVLGNDQN